MESGKQVTLLMGYGHMELITTGNGLTIKESPKTFTGRKPIQITRLVMVVTKASVEQKAISNTRSNAKNVSKATICCLLRKEVKILVIVAGELAVCGAVALKAIGKMDSGSLLQLGIKLVNGLMDTG